MLDYSFFIGLGLGVLLCYYIAFRLRKRFNDLLVQREHRLFMLTTITEKLVCSATLQRNGLLSKEVETTLLEGINMSEIEKTGISIRGLSNRNLSRVDTMKFCLDRLQENLDFLEKDANDPWRWKKST